MASKVNKKFVILLSAGLVAVFGAVAGAYLYIQTTSGDRNFRKAEAALAQGKIVEADGFIGRAVNKDQTNVAYLEKWREIREKKVADTEPIYRDEYVTYIRGILRQIAVVQRTNVKAHEDYLGALYRELVEGGGGREAWSNLAAEANTALGYFGTEQPLPIRRYRGLALVAVGMLDPRQEAEQRDKGREDLEAVLKADPKDTAVAMELAASHLTSASQARQTGRTAEAEKSEQTARRVIGAVVAADPTSPRAIMAELTLKLSELQVVDPSKSPAQVGKERMAAIETMKPRLAEMLAGFAKAEPASLDIVTISRLFAISGQIDGVQGARQALPIIEKTAAARPMEANYGLFLGDALERLREPARAMEVYSRIAKMPNQPISLQGFLLFQWRPRAQFLMANVAAGQALAKRGTGEAAAAIEAAKAQRAELAKVVPAEAAELVFIDARLAMAEQNYPLVQELVRKFERSPGMIGSRIPDALLLLAEASLRKGEPGLARDTIARYTSMRPGTVEPLLLLAELEMQFRNVAEAAKVYRRILDLDPTNEAALQNLPLLQSISTGDIKGVEDPVVRIILQADAVSRGDATTPGDDRKAAEMLEKALEANKFDPRLVLAAAKARAGLGDRAAALALLDRGIQLHKDDKRLQQFRELVVASDSLEGTLKLIAEGEGDELTKGIARLEAYARFNTDGQHNDAYNRELDALAAKHGEHPNVLERVFVRHIDRNEIDRARALAEKASTLNLDGAGGDTYRARLSIQEGKLTDAANMLQRAVDRGNATAAANRLLGIVYAQLNRPQDALRAYAAAYKLNPNDPQTVLGYLDLMARTDQRQEALTLARQTESFMRGDNRFVNLWLNLEAASGNITFARERREAQLARNPKDVENKSQLAELYMTERNWDKSRKLIDEVKAEPNMGILPVMLEARWHADRGNMPEANRTFVNYIDELTKKNELKDPQPYLAFAGFLLSRNQANLALKAYEQAARFQDPKTRDIELRMGDVMLQRGLFVEAEALYRKLLGEGLEDPKFDIRKRLIESLVQQQKWAEAEAEFQKLGTFADEDLEALLQRASVARWSGDRKRARELLDKAVVRHPEAPMPYVRRGRLLMNDPESTRDALEDFGAAIRLRPTMWQALRSRGLLQIVENRPTEGLRDLQAAVEANPDVEGLRFEYIRVLLQLGREADAVNAAESGLKRRPNDIGYAASLAELFQSYKAWPRAARFYREIWQQAPQQGLGPYIRALLQQTPPAISEAEAALRSERERIDKDSELLLLRAAIRRKQNKMEEARADIRASLANLPGKDPGFLMAWHERFRQVMEKPEEALATFKDLRPGGIMENWLTLWRARADAEIEANRASAIERLKELNKQATDATLQFYGRKVLTNALMLEKRWAEAADEMKATLQMMPDDAETQNNLAFALSEHLDRGEEALARAQKAVELAPSNPLVVDTLAGVLWRIGKKPEAISTLRRATFLAWDEEPRAKARIKLCRWQLETGDKQGASATLDTLQEQLVDDYGLRATLLKELEALEREVRTR